MADVCMHTLCPSKTLLAAMSLVRFRPPMAPPFPQVPPALLMAGVTVPDEVVGVASDEVDERLTREEEEESAGGPWQTVTRSCFSTCITTTTAQQTFECGTKNNIIFELDGKTRYTIA